MEGGREPTWPELLGSNNWEGLLDPLNLTLRRLILRCGDLCQATYDAFNNDTHSKYNGCGRCGKKDFFKKVGFPPDEDYIVSSFLYATASVDLPVGFLVQSLSREAWSRESNWIGYIAVSSDKSTQASGRREIYVAWRGTIRDLEWTDVLDPESVSIEPLLAKKDVGCSSDDPPKLLSKIKELVSLYKDEKEQLSLVCAGHSLGACLSILSAFDVVEDGLSKIGDRPEFPVTAFVFGSPEVGNKAFNERLKKLPNLRVLLVKNEIDLIPDYPGQLLGYTDTGVKLVVDTRKSPYLKDSKNPGDWHNLQGLLHVVAGWNGKEGEFGFKVKRSIGLVNKSCDLLKDECLIPGSWWVEKNRGMVLEKDGEWQLASPSEEDMPVPEY
ncbi:hypothetical protein MRB53_012718 [Persea americana]|uniref:Uncharacterized protein n=1 Tax=Persea americana TaxID=3435 RepID=A0ACC2LZE3_PERAE|nr:hypothetical protein MRB53_012718 [Persea americana]